MEAIKAYRVKALNRRIEIVIYQNKNNHTSISVFTKRLLDFKKRNKNYDDMYYNRKLAMPNEVVEEIEYNNKQIKFLSSKLPRKYYGKI